MDIIFAALAVAFLTYLIRCYGRCKKPLKCFFINTGLGIGSFIVLALVCTFTGTALGVNCVTCTVAAVFGIPGVILLALNLFII